MANPAALSRPAMDQPKWQENLNMALICRDCKEIPPNLIEEFSSGDVVCGSCGLVLGDRIVDTRSEWRTFSNDDSNNDDPSRVGDADNPLLNGQQLHTQIAYDNGGNSKSRDLHRAQQKATQDKVSQNLQRAYRDIAAYTDAMQIPRDVSNTAMALYKAVEDAKVLKGKPTDVLAAGCIFIACRQCKVPRTFREVSAVTKVTIKEIGRIFKVLEKFFATQSQEKMEATMKAGTATTESDSYTTTLSTDPQSLVIRFCSHLGLPPVTRLVAEALAEKMSNFGALAGRSPLSVAAACIYMASYFTKHGRTAKEISAIAGVSDGTIRTAYKYLYAERETLIKPEWIKNGKGDMKFLPPS